MGRYVTGVDQTITALLEEDGTMGYNELWKGVNSQYQKTSLGSFDYHIKNLLSNNVIGKEDSGRRGKAVLYFLTKQAKQEMALKLLNTMSRSEKSQFELVEEEKKQLMLFFVLFFFDTHPIRYRLKEDEIDQFLSKFDLKLHGLVVKDQESNDQIQGNKTISSTKCIYYDLPVDKLKFYAPNYQDDLLLWKEVLSVKKDYENIPVLDVVRSTRDGRFIVIPSPKQIRKTFEELSREERTTYVYELPGVSISDIVSSAERPILENVNFTKEESEEVISLAIKRKLLKPILEFNNELRYAVSNYNLRKFFGDLVDLYDSIKYKIVVTWVFHRQPTKGEIKWMNLFEGIGKTQEFRDYSYIYRHKLGLKKRKEALKDFIKPQEMIIKDNLDKVKKKHYKVIKKYDIPLARLLKFVYPSYIHTSSENYDLMIGQ